MVMLAFLSPILAAAAPIPPADLPAAIVAAIEREIPGITITGAERKTRDGRHYYDVEGLRLNGEEVELDLLHTPQGWQVVEIQRDIAWVDVPANARAAALPALKDAVPVRVIESIQTDGRIIYELFVPGAPAKPAFEVMTDDGKAHLLTEEWPH